MRSKLALIAAVLATPISVGTAAAAGASLSPTLEPHVPRVIDGAPRCFRPVIEAERLLSEKQAVPSSNQYRKPTVYPPVYQRTTVRILVRPEYEEVSVVPAEVIPAISREVVVRDGYRNYHDICRTEQIAPKEITLREAYRTWRPREAAPTLEVYDGVVPRNLPFPDAPPDPTMRHDLWQTIEIPPIKEEIPFKEITYCDPSYEQIGPEKKHVQTFSVRPAQIIRTRVPAEYRTEEQWRIVKDAWVDWVEVPPDYVTVDVTELAEPAMVKWEEVQCPAQPPIPASALQEPPQPAQTVIPVSKQSFCETDVAGRPCPDPSQGSQPSRAASTPAAPGGPQVPQPSADPLAGGPDGT